MEDGGSTPFLHTAFMMLNLKFGSFYLILERFYYIEERTYAITGNNIRPRKFIAGFQPVPLKKLKLGMLGYVSALSEI
jgi:hypothetical protein